MSGFGGDLLQGNGFQTSERVRSSQPHTQRISAEQFKLDACGLRALSWNMIARSNLPSRNPLMSLSFESSYSNTFVVGTDLRNAASAGGNISIVETGSQRATRYIRHEPVRGLLPPTHRAVQ
jgi:hypothetical protein